MREHIRILGILNIVVGCFAAFAGIAALGVMGSVAKILALSSGIGDEDATAIAPIIAGVGVGVGIFLLLLAAPAVIGGWGLLHYRPWSRALMIVLSVLHLLHIPIGTALGVYGLWVLFSDETKRLLESGGHVFQPVAGAYSPLSVPPPQAGYPAPTPPAV